MNERSWVQRDPYNKLTITKWRPWRTIWRFLVVAYG